MKKLNLENINKSDIKWHIINFPDGEVSIEIDDEIDHKIDYIDIYVRITSAEKLFILMQVCDILKRHGIEYNIMITYLMSMRMDRVMSWNRPFSLKVVADMIKLCEAHNVYVLEPHSNRTITELGGLTMINPMTEIQNNAVNDVLSNTNHVVIFPDAGAKERYTNMNVDNNRIILFDKKRDIETGKILSLEPKKKEISDSWIKIVSDITVIDDLCDGGGTFVGIAKYIRTLNPTCKLQILLTHAVNPDGIKNLYEYYDNITITNSYANWTNNKKINVLEVI
ncbi:MAG: hypothetical protein J6D03_06970 [Clostridia bacterium]|nr:hypothetical protein [Clostridia bacterium]